MEKNNLPNVGTPSQAREKMKEGYKSFLDASAKFITIAEFYVDKANEGQQLPNNFSSKYTTNYQKLKEEKHDDFGNDIAFYTLLLLDFIDDIKENLKAYEDILANGPDKEASQYDQACDYLAIRDEFIDITEELNDTMAQILYDKYAETNYNDPDYDLNAKLTELNRFKN